MIKTVLTAAGAMALAMAALPATAADQKPGDKPAARNQCFYTREVNSFSAADNKTVYVRVGVRDVYRLDLFAPCPDVDWNQRIALESRGTDWICSALDATIITRSQIGPQRCPVTMVTKLTPAEVATLPKRAKP